MRAVKLLLSCLLLFLISCTQAPRKTEVKNKDLKKTEAPEKENVRIGLPKIAEENILVNFGKFWEYYTENIELYEDFIAFNSNGKPISKLQFLSQLKSGLYFPLILNSKDEQLNYKLVKIPAKADPNISVYMKQFGKEQLAFYHLEGKPAPAFNFTDVNGKLYTPENTKGKIILFKCWFINCLPCRQEMPALNEVVRKYKNRDDILFISLAIDTKKELQTFLSTTKFDYATVPNQGKYMSDKLHVSGYPTHFIINKKGELVRMLPDVAQVEEAIEKELAK